MVTHHDAIYPHLSLVIGTIEFQLYQLPRHVFVGLDDFAIPTRTTHHMTCGITSRRVLAERTYLLIVVATWQRNQTKIVGQVNRLPISDIIVHKLSASQLGWGKKPTIVDQHLTHRLILRHVIITAITICSLCG